ncbi:MAG: N-acetyl sugar amidotransferase [Alphaproteobacteria bacterium]|nr:N-acetyl sugar amidotransferase [Alphaproteobacteria bacterium]
MHTCTKCVMPETAESLAFDGDGQCSVCHQIDFKRDNIDWDARKKELHELVELHRGKNDYDCIVPFSGGKDSAFTLWYLVRELGLKCLVVRFDHLFMRPVVEANADRVFKRLGVDSLRFSPNWKVVRKLMYESLVRRGDFCWHCHTGIFAYPMWTSLRYQVPLLFWGEPGAEYSSFYSYDEIEEANERRFNRKINLGINAEDMLGMLDDTISDYKVELRDLKPFTYPPAKDLRAAGTRSVFLGYYIQWDVRKQVEIIEKELGWERDEVEGVPPEYNYEKIECFMQGVRDYIKFLKRGFGRTAHLASIDIRNNRLSREEGVELVEKYDGRRPAALDRFLKILEIDEKDFMEVIERHVVAPNVMPKAEDILRVNKEPDDFAGFDKKLAGYQD